MGQIKIPYFDDKQVALKDVLLYPPSLRPSDHHLTTA